MKKRFTILAIAVALPILIPVGYVGFTFIGAHRFIQQSRHYLLQEVDRNEIADACLTVLMQHKDDSDATVLDLNDESIPEALRNLGAAWAVVENNELTIMYLSGHYHMGYIFRSMDDGVGDEAYELVFVDEGGRQNGQVLSMIIITRC